MDTDIAFFRRTKILRGCLESMIRMLCCYKFNINGQKFFGILNNIAKNFCPFILNFSKQIIRSDFSDTLLKLFFFLILLFMNCLQLSAATSQMISLKDLPSELSMENSFLSSLHGR